MRVADLRTPSLVCSLAVLERNAKTMLDRAAERGCALRPHLKTCKTVRAAEYATGFTRRRVAVSTLAEARFFADAGFDDILYAMPLSPDKVPEAAALTQRLSAFHVLVDHPDQVAALLRAGPQLAASGAGGAKRFSVFVGLDSGYHRDGVDPDDPSSIELVRSLATSEHAVFAGIYTHAGQSYDCANADAIEAVATAERDASVAFASALRAAGLEVPCVGVGSTPTCSRPPPSLDGIDEMHPGDSRPQGPSLCLPSLATRGAKPTPLCASQATTCTTT